MSFHHAPDTARIDLAVESMQSMVDQVSGIEVTADMTMFFLDCAARDWIRVEDDWHVFRNAICVAWNDKQDRIRRSREY